MKHMPDPFDSQRHRYLEAAQAELEETLGWESVQRRFSEEQVCGLRSGAARLVIANVRNQRVTLPRQYRDSDAVPLIAIRPGERFILDNWLRVPSPLQRDLAVEAFVEWRADDSPDLQPQTELKAFCQRLAANSYGSKIPAGTTTVAFCGSNRVPMRCADREQMAAEGYVACGRPLVGLVMDEKNGPLSSLLAHELIHVDQRNLPLLPAEPSLYSEECIRGEAEASAIGARYELGVRASGDSRFSFDKFPEFNSHITVEYVRAKYAPADDPYFPTPALKKVLADTMGYSLHYPFEVPCSSA